MEEDKVVMITEQNTGSFGFDNASVYELSEEDKNKMNKPEDK